MKMGIFSVIILCAALWTNVNAYTKEITSLTLTHCKDWFGAIHKFKGYILEGEKDGLIERPNAEEDFGRQCIRRGFEHVRLGKARETFVAAEWNETSKKCSAYASEMTGKRTIKPIVPGGDITLLVASTEKEICGKFLNPCVPSDAVCTDVVCTDVRLTAFSCTCESACGKFDIPENWTKCPSFYIDFEDNTNCPGYPAEFISTGKKGRGLSLLADQSTMLGPFAACTVNPLTCGNTSEFSLSFWLKTVAGSRHNIFSVTNETRNGNKYAGFQFRESSSNLYFTVDNPDTDKRDAVKLNPSVPSSWIYYTLKYNGSNINVEIDNTPVIPLQIFKFDQDSILVPDQPVIYFGQLESDGGAEGDFELDELLVST